MWKALNHVFAAKTFLERERARKRVCVEAGAHRLSIVNMVCAGFKRVYCVTLQG